MFFDSRTFFHYLQVVPVSLRYYPQPVWNYVEQAGVLFEEPRLNLFVSEELQRLQYDMSRFQHSLPPASGAPAHHAAGAAQITEERYLLAAHRYSRIVHHVRSNSDAGTTNRFLPSTEPWPSHYRDQSGFLLIFLSIDRHLNATNFGFFLRDTVSRLLLTGWASFVFALQCSLLFGALLSLVYAVTK